MSGYAQVRDALHSGTLQTERLDAAQLVKHAFGLRTQAQPAEGVAAKRPVLVYLYAEPAAWPDGRAVAPAYHAIHRQEIARFADMVTGDEVRFVAISYRELLEGWKRVDDARVREHAEAIERVFAP